MPLYQLTWDLDAFFPGGSRSEAFASFLQDLDRRMEELARPLEALIARTEAAAAPGTGAAGSLPPQELDAWAGVVDGLQDAGARLHQARAFVSCLTAQDVNDEPARLLEGRLTQMSASLRQLFIGLDRALVALPEAAWESLAQDPRLQPVRFTLEERRARAQELLPPREESLVASLAVDGYHGWGSLYDTVSGRIRIAVEEDGETRELSVGQVFNRLQSPDRTVRESLWPRYEQAWQQEADLCAAALNHLGGFRLNLYRERGWTSVLKEPLDNNRMSEASLNALWQAVEGAKEPLVAYLQRKARLLGVERLQWHDVGAPVGRVDRRFTYDEAAAFIIQHFGAFSPELAEFARRAFEHRWIEAEDRPGKRAGGFCTSFPRSGESRIFTTFSGTPDNVSTLAHELGHAYHGHVLRDLPYMARHYPMNLAETASTFAERIVTDAALRQAASREERLALLDQQLQDAVSFLMNIHARFLFETRFYEARRRGPVAVPELNRMMEEAQRDAYRGVLGGYHPGFWASKLHFYLTGQPFYNFPYTFGYLFSTGLYARARQEGPAFAPRYVALLQDTGRMTVEELARRHLGVDLTQTAFWEEAAREAVSSVEAFLQET